jgi:hypothetical protein
MTHKRSSGRPTGPEKDTDRVQSLPCGRARRENCQRLIVAARTHLRAANGEVVPSDWELFYGTTNKDYRGQKIFKALFLKAIERFETIYAQVHPGNKSEMAKTLLRWGFTEEARSYNGTIEFKLTRGR